MPELPEVEALRRLLTERAVGRPVSRVDVAAISVLKTYDPPVTALAGLFVSGVARHGKFLDVEVGGEAAGAAPLHLIVHLARAGWLQWRENLPPVPPKPGKGPLALRVHLGERDDDPDGIAAGFDLTEAGTKKGLAVYCVRAPADVPGVARLGPGPTGAGVRRPTTSAALLAAAGRSQLKGVLRDQSILAGIGNAYSDEVLHAARLSPFKPANSLDEAEVAALHAIIRETLADAISRARGPDHPGPQGGEEGRAAGARPDRAAVPGVRGHRARGVLRGLCAAVLRDLSDRREAAGRPAHVAAAQVGLLDALRPQAEGACGREW